MKAKKYRIFQFSSSHAGIPKGLFQGGSEEARSVGSHSRKATLVGMPIQEFITRGLFLAKYNAPPK